MGSSSRPIFFLSKKKRVDGPWTTKYEFINKLRAQEKLVTHHILNNNNGFHQLHFTAEGYIGIHPHGCTQGDAVLSAVAFTNERAAVYGVNILRCQTIIQVTFVVENYKDRFLAFRYL